MANQMFIIPNPKQSPKVRVDYARNGSTFYRIVPNDGSVMTVLRGVNAGKKPMESIGLSNITRVSKHHENCPRK